jgi:hypothetical protein
LDLNPDVQVFQVGVILAAPDVSAVYAFALQVGTEVLCFGNVALHLSIGCGVSFAQFCRALRACRNIADDLQRGQERVSVGVVRQVCHASLWHTKAWYVKQWHSRGVRLRARQQRKSQRQRDFGSGARAAARDTDRLRLNVYDVIKMIV